MFFRHVNGLSSVQVSDVSCVRYPVRRIRKIRNDTAGPHPEICSLSIREIIFISQIHNYFNYYIFSNMVNISGPILKNCNFDI